MKATAFAAVCSVFFLTHSAPAQLTLNGESYRQTFNELSSGLPAGWSVRTNAAASNPGADAPFAASATGWSATTGQFGNFAATTHNDGTVFAGAESAAVQAAATNRCLGLRQTSSFGDPGAAFVLRIQNTVGFGDVELALDLNQLNPQGRSTVWTVDYGFGNPPENFVPIGTYNDPGVFGSSSARFSFGDALDNQAQEIWIRIVALAPSTGSGSRDTFGIDNVVLSYGPFTPNTNPPAIHLQPQSQTRNATAVATFAVGVDGAAPMNFRWRKNEVDLSNGGKVSGADTATLTLSNLLAADSGSYSVSVSNGFGSTNSADAGLAVIDPVFTAMPFSRTNLQGDTAMFSATAVGTGPLRFHWQLNGEDIFGATATVLSLTNVQSANQGSYSLVASNTSGVVTSTVATLTLFQTPSIRLAQWDFNTTNTLLASAPPCSRGSGWGCLLGSASGAFGSGSSSDPADWDGAVNNGWNTSSYPPQNSSNKTAGVEFRTSTAGYRNLLLAWEQRNSATASKFVRLQYTTNGSDFLDANVIAAPQANGGFGFFAVSLATTPGVNDNPNFAFRLVTEFESTATGGGLAGYQPTSAASSYSAAGTIRYDWVNVFADPLGSAIANPLQIESAGTNVILTWTNPALGLETAAQLTGSYTNIVGASSPFTNAVVSPQKYFRLKAQ